MGPEADHAELTRSSKALTASSSAGQLRIGGPAERAPSSSMDLHEADDAGRAGAGRCEPRGPGPPSPSQVDHPTRLAGTNDADLPESTIGVGVRKLRRLDGILTGSRSHGARYDRYRPRGAISRGVGDLAAGIRGYAPAVYFLIYADRSRRSRPISENTQIGRGAMRLICGNTKMGRGGSRPTCWTTEIGRASQLIATLDRRR